MKTNAKMKFLSILLCLTMIIGMVPMTAITAVGAEASPESDFTFDSSTGTITKYTGSGGDVVIPSTIGGSGGHSHRRKSIFGLYRSYISNHSRRRYSHRKSGISGLYRSYIGDYSRRRYND